MEPERFLRIFPIFVKTWIILMGSAVAFFYLSKNAALKRKIWPAFVSVIGAMFMGFMLFMGAPLPFLALGTTAVLLMMAVNLKSVSFCDRCARMSRGKSFSPPEICSKCGAEIKRLRSGGR